MSRSEELMKRIQFECPNLLPTKHRESPDLITQCMSGQLIEVDNAHVGTRDDTDSPANETDIVISDDDTPSFNSDATNILDPDIIINYDGKSVFGDSDLLSTASCSTPKIRVQQSGQNIGWIRCKPMKDLLSSDTVSSSKARMDDEIENGANLGGVNVTNVRTLDSDSSESSSSPIPPSPTSIRLRPRRRRLVLSGNNTTRDSRNNPNKPPYENTKVGAMGKHDCHRLFMKEWSMHEATPPTSGSEQNDEDFETQTNNDFHQRIPASTGLLVRKKFTPKYILDKNLRVIGTIKTPTVESIEGKVYNTRSTKVNFGCEIQHLLNPLKSSNHLNDDNDTHVHNKSETHTFNNILGNDENGVIGAELLPKTARFNVCSVEGINERSISGKLNETIGGRNHVVISCNMKKVNPYIQWTQRYPKIEEQISRERDIPIGSNYCQWERLGMIWWLLKADKISVARLKGTWAEMRENGYLKHRTVRSLQNHFLRKILPNLQDFALPSDVIEEFGTITH